MVCLLGHEVERGSGQMLLLRAISAISCPRHPSESNANRVEASALKGGGASLY